MDRARWAPAADGGVDSLTGTSLAAGTPAGRGGSGRSAKGAGRRRAVPSCVAPCCVAPCVCLCVSLCVSTSCARVCGAVCLRGRSRGARWGSPLPWGAPRGPALLPACVCSTAAPVPSPEDPGCTGLSRLTSALPVLRSRPRGHGPESAGSAACDSRCWLTWCQVPVCVGGWGGGSCRALAGVGGSCLRCCPVGGVLSMVGSWD